MNCSYCNGSGIFEEESDNDAVDAVEFRMEQMGHKQKDLLFIFKTHSRVSEFLSRKRTPSLAQIKRLHKEYFIPAKVLLREIKKI